MLGCRSAVSEDVAYERNLCDIRLKLLVPATCLSPPVQNLICITGVTKHGFDEQSVTDENLLRWEHLDRILPPVQKDSPDYFAECVGILRSSFGCVLQKFQSMTIKEYSENFSHLLQWTGSAELFVDCFEMTTQNSNVKCLLSLLLTTAVLERALGDVFLLEGVQCPSMLKDLLVTSQLENIFGQTAIQILRIIMGPSVSLNLRNVTWHGFPAPGEIPKQYASYVLMLVPSLGKVLLERHHICEIKHRPAVSFPQLKFLTKTSLGWKQIGHYHSQFQQLFAESQLILPSMLSVWNMALKLHAGERYGHFVALMLPQLEHSLRRIFCTVNECHERLLTAQSNKLYTTLDEILAQSLPDKQENQMLKLLGEPLMDLLFDLFVYPDGPRIRDRVSHGETSFGNFPEVLADAVLTLAIAFAHLFVSPHSSVHQIEAIKCVVSQCEEYESEFHPVALTKQQVANLMIMTSKLDSHIWYTPDLTKRNHHHSKICNSGNEVDTLLQQNIFEIMEDVLKVWNPEVEHLELMSQLFSTKCDASVIKKITSKKIRTLYRGHAHSTEQDGKAIKENEIINLLHKITSECYQVITQVQTNVILRQQQLEKKELRSRQRENLKKMLHSIPSLCSGVQVIALYVLCELYRLDQFSSLPLILKKKTLRFLKTALQYCENLNSYTHLDKNKWTGSMELTLQFITKARSLWLFS